MAPRIAYLGMGNMGKAMSRNLAQKGGLDAPIVLWTRTRASADAHAAALGGPEHAVVVDSAADAVAQADHIWSCLASEDAVRTTFDAILAHDVRGKLFVECSTGTPEACAALAERVLAAGAEFVAMPVFGEPSMAAAGVLTCVPAGAASSVAKVKPYLIGIVGRAVIDYSGVAPAQAALLKVIGNTFIMGMIEVLAEGHVLAEKTGLGAANLEKFIETVFPGPYMIHSRRMTSGAYFKTEPMVNIGMARKVASHVLALAEGADTKLPAYEVANRHLAVVEEHVGAQGDIDGIYGAARLASGLPYENS